MGDVVPDPKYSGMWRSPLSGSRMSDMANLSWAKNAVLAAATRELEWEARDKPAIRPSIPSESAPVFEATSSLMR
jgi:hypothetical protein